jgi:2-keto-4-pentenoate hydratase
MTAPWNDARVQRGMEKLFRLRAERIAAGDRQIGWKVAFGGKAMQEKLGIGAPVVGYLLRGAAVASGDSISLHGWKKPVAESEIATFMGRDLPAGSDPVAAKAAIAKLGPAIEMIDSERPPEDIEWLLSGNISNRHVVLGPSASVDPDALRGRVVRRGQEFMRADDPQAMPGKVANLLAYVADYLAAFGEKLRANDVVICGAIVQPTAVEADEEIFGYALDPVGEVTVRFKR